ncbi:MAG: hypothetical protein M0C28_16875 [Candidatus Moduliflexus flocculans]|nr:hypothetical protein [Candidatus Moduliflexus flocculans]
MQRHYYKHLKGEKTSTNSMALDLRLDGRARASGASSTARPSVVSFAKTLEKVIIETVEGGVMTKDLMLIADPPVSKYSLTGEFIDTVAAKLKAALVVRTL